MQDFNCATDHLVNYLVDQGIQKKTIHLFKMILV